MKIRYTEKEFNESISTDLLALECYHCNKIFRKRKNLIIQTIKGNNKCSKYCSIHCKNNSTMTKQNVICMNCQVTFLKKPSEINRSKNNFCSRSCSATFSNRNKTKGTRRSKLELFIEEQLYILYPNLQIDFNKKDTIGSELDIYIPSLKIAFEVQGIFHYVPIYGENKLEKIQNNDKNKLQNCISNNIHLHIIDTTEVKNFSPTKSQKFISIIVDIISKNLKTGPQ